MPVQRCAYRWAAAILGRFVRDELRDLRDLLEIPPDRSPVLNRAVRDAALAICIQDPVTGYLLARHLTTLPRAAQVALDPDACPLERAAGAAAGAAAGPDTANTPVQPPAYLGPVAAKG